MCPCLVLAFHLKFYSLGTPGPTKKLTISRLRISPCVLTTTSKSTKPESPPPSAQSPQSCRGGPPWPPLHYGLSCTDNFRKRGSFATKPKASSDLNFSASLKPRDTASSSESRVELLSRFMPNARANSKTRFGFLESISLAN